MTSLMVPDAVELPPDGPPCPVCSDPMNLALVRTCPACETPMHPECSDYTGGCARFQCPEAGDGRRREEMFKEILHRQSFISEIKERQDALQRRWSWASSLMGVSTLLLAWDDFWQTGKLRWRLWRRTRLQTPWLADDPAEAPRLRDAPGWVFEGLSSWSAPSAPSPPRAPGLAHGLGLFVVSIPVVSLGLAWLALGPHDSWIGMTAFFATMGTLAVVPMVLVAHARAWLDWRTRSLAARGRRLQAALRDELHLPGRAWDPAAKPIQKTRTPTGRRG